MAVRGVRFGGSAIAPGDVGDLRVPVSAAPKPVAALAANDVVFLTSALPTSKLKLTGVGLDQDARRLAHGLTFLRVVEKLEERLGEDGLIEAQIPAQQFKDMGLREGETLVVTPRRAKVFLDEAAGI